LLGDQGAAQQISELMDPFLFVAVCPVDGVVALDPAVAQHAIRR